MKLADLNNGSTYFVSNDKNWQETGDGRFGRFTGNHEGFNVEMIDVDSGADFVVSLPRVRATQADAMAVLATVYAEKERKAERLKKIHRMVNVVMAEDGFGEAFVSAGNGSAVLFDADALEALLNTARRAQKAAKGG